MSEKRELRMGVIGVGSMGAVHAKDMLAGKVARAKLVAVCDEDPEALARFPEVQQFASSRELIASGAVDAVLIATPHFDHTPIAIDALGAGLHVLCEKPLGVHKADCLKMIAAYEARPKSEQVFAEMFNQRADPRFIKLRQLIKSGELGALRRMNWIITDWFRTETYYRSGGWRATWRGEGGGVLLNQCPHNLDLWQWLFGMPKRVHAFCGFGRFHEIEVEDQVTAYLDYDGGTTGVFVTTTAEAPGTNRLEVVGDLGKIVLDADGLRFTKNEVSMMEFLKTSPERYTMPKTTTELLPIAPGGPFHNTVTRNFVDAIFDGEPLIAPAPEGLASVELSNAMIYSGLTGRTIELPLDANVYAAELARLVKDSRYTKPEIVRTQSDDMSSSFR
ncbi:MAG TPA: Gfo/Idh/MocA family oxidoreductase [Polyangiaceae bacterium]|jgi:predicted dehydrogenase|nr:Gfo/Idh/MocA family oxidoreductase [Polyangiaceae bacterium]